MSSSPTNTFQIMAGSGTLRHVRSGIDTQWLAAVPSAQRRLQPEDHALTPRRLSKKSKKEEKFKLLLPQQNALLDTFGSLLTWSGDVDSTDLEDIMGEAVSHHPHNRWGAIVVDDRVKNFFDTSIYIPASALSKSPDDLFHLASQAHATLCNGTDSDSTSASVSERKGHELWNIEKSLFFCGKWASTRIGLARSYNLNTSNSALVISAYASLHANISLICNTTAHHAAPIFLKEVVTAAFGAVQNLSPAAKKHSTVNPIGDKIPNTQGADKAEIRGAELQFKNSPQYDLYSHPFPEINLSNEAAMWRGYLGASFVLLFMLLCTMVAVRFIPHFRSSGMKHMIHLAGVSPSSYWIANYICDSVIMFVILFCILCGIYLGGAPVSSFYFDLPPYPGLLFLAVITTFSLAIVAGNYAFCALSTDPLTSQLSCVMSSILVGVCLKLYIRLHKSKNYSKLSTIMTIISPSFAFTSALFDMFSQYADNIGKSSGVLHSANCPGLLESVGFDISMMLCQAIGYLFLTVLIDKYWILVKVFVARVMPSLPRKMCGLFGSAWGGMRRASTHTVSRLENDFSLRFMWNRSDGMQSPPVMERDLDIDLETPGNNTPPSESSMLLPHRTLSRTYSDPEIEDSAVYGSIMDISESELRRRSMSREAAHKAAVMVAVGSKAERAPIAAAAPVVVIDSLCIDYAWHSVPAVQSLAMTIKQRDRVALVGVNGGGTWCLCYVFFAKSFYLHYCCMISCSFLQENQHCLERLALERQPFHAADQQLLWEWMWSQIRGRYLTIDLLAMSHKREGCWNL